MTEKSVNGSRSYLCDFWSAFRNKIRSIRKADKRVNPWQTDNAGVVIAEEDHSEEF